MGIVFEFDKLRSAFGLPELDQEAEWDYLAQQTQYARDSADDEEESSEAAIEKIERKAQEEFWRAYASSVMDAVTDAFENIGLDATLLKSGKVDVSPAKSWDDAARKIMGVVGGMGLFHVSGTLKEFLRENSSTGGRRSLLAVTVTFRYFTAHGPSTGRGRSCGRSRRPGGLAVRIEEARRTARQRLL